MTKKEKIIVIKGQLAGCDASIKYNKKKIREIEEKEKNIKKLKETIDHLKNGTIDQQIKAQLEILIETEKFDLYNRMDKQYYKKNIKRQRYLISVWKKELKLYE